jgi:hypothetical protein
MTRLKCASCKGTTACLFQSQSSSNNLKPTNKHMASTVLLYRSLIKGGQYHRTAPHFAFVSSRPKDLLSRGASHGAHDCGTSYEAVPNDGQLRLRAPFRIYGGVNQPPNHSSHPSDVCIQQTITFLAPHLK